MRCAACQAILPNGAQWCGQCYAAVPATGGPFAAPAYPQPAYPQPGYPAPAYPAPSFGAPASTFGSTGSAQAFTPAAGYAPPGYGPVPGSASPSRRSKAPWIGGALATVLVAGALFSYFKPSPTLHLADVSMPTPSGWSKASVGDAQDIAAGMAASMSSGSGFQAVGARKDGHHMAALASVVMPVAATADALDGAFQGLTGQEFKGSTVTNVSRTTVGSHAAIRIDMSGSSLTGSMVLIPEGTTLILCIAGNDTGATSDSDVAWITSHLTATGT